MVVATAAIVVVCIAAMIIVVTTGSGKLEIDKIDEDKKLVVYTSHEKDVYEPVIAEFERRTGIWVEVVTGGTNELLDRIENEKGQPYADVMFGGGIDSISSRPEMFDTWDSFSKFPVVFIYNTKLVYEAGVPQKWEDLLDSYWKGKIAMASPSISGSSYTAMSTLIQMVNKDEPKEIIGKLKENCAPSFLASSGKVVEEVSTGEKLVGITSEDKALKRCAMDKNIGIVYPSDGTTAVPDATAIVKNAKHVDNAQLFLDFTTSEDVQKYIEEFCFRRSVLDSSSKAPLEKEIDYDYMWANENKKVLLEEIGYEN